MSTATWKIWTDGSFRNDHCYLGFHICLPNGRNRSYSQCAGKGFSSLEAEALAMHRSMRTARRLGAHSVHLYSDCQVLVNMVLGNVKPRSGQIRHLVNNIRRQCELLDSIEITWIPRKKNKIADRLARKCKSEPGTGSGASESSSAGAAEESGAGAAEG